MVRFLVALLVLASAATARADDDDVVPVKDASISGLLRLVARGREDVARRKLAAMPEGGAEDALEILGLSEDPEVLVGAATLLSGSKNRGAALEVARRRLKEAGSKTAEERALRLAAIEATGALASSRDLAPVVKIAKTASLDEAAAAARGLTRASQSSAHRALFEIGEDLLETIASERRVARASGNQGGLSKAAAVEGRLEMLLGVIRTAIKKLPQGPALAEAARDARASPQLLEPLLAATRSEVRLAVARVGKQRRDADDPAMRAAAMRLIAVGRQPEAADTLVAGLGDEAFEVRAAACEALTGISRRQARARASALVRRLEDENPAVRAAAQRALVKIFGVRVPGTVQHWERFLAARQKASDG